MIAYFDTSALVPLLADEPSSARCGELWDAATRVVTCRLAYVETAAALAMAERQYRITKTQSDQALQQLDALWPQLDLIEIDAALARAAASAARRHGLRGYDAVHFAAACQLGFDETVAVCGDAHLLAAWREAGLATADPNAAI